MAKFIVTTSKGLDELLYQEIQDIAVDIKDESLNQLKLTPGQVSFESDLRLGYACCLNSRLANRVLLVLKSSKISSAQDVYNLASAIDWPTHFSNYVPFAVFFNGTNAAINNSQFGALTIKDAVVDSFIDDDQDRPNVDKLTPGFVIQARLKRDNLDICLDMSGGSLHRRGYREGAGEAPLKEHVAAALLMRSGWSNDQQTLLDPMCGSGTLVIEAALMAANIPAQLRRTDWGFEHWLRHEELTWSSLIHDAKQKIRAPSIQIMGSDSDFKILEQAKSNAEKAGVLDYISFEHVNLLEINKAPSPEGFLISNPPYGERLGQYTTLLPMFEEFGIKFKQCFKNWRVGLITSNESLLKALKLRSKRKYKLMNGPLECVFCIYELQAENLTEFVTKLDDNHEFANRLKKNIRKLQPFIKKQTTNAYRVYDADLPHYNLAVDVYNDWVVVQEYSAPKHVPEEKAKQRLQQALRYIPNILNVSEQKLSVKVRKRNKGNEQYEKMESSGITSTVYENGAKFHINPVDYLDVGLFLDHRDIRKRVSEEAKYKDVLNLFSYTGSVSVHAALGGARSVVSVDLSKTYLKWAEKNFLLNELSGHYEFIHANCIDWMRNCNQTFDLIFVDPPSFSNSKRMETTWDVQRDHVDLLRNAKQCLNKHGKVFFSTNLRRFRLDDMALKKLGFSITDITEKSMPIDFSRNKQIHKCWILE